MLESHTQYVTEQWLLPVRKVRNSVANFLLHAFDVILLVLDCYRILVAYRNDLGGHSDCSNDACCDRKAIHGAMCATASQSGEAQNTLL
jgi:hypothetical protein